MESLKPEILIITSAEFAHGVENDYYPELTKAQNLGKIKICTYTEAQSQHIPIDSTINLKGSTIYMLNKYNQNYIEVNDCNLKERLITSKCLAIKEVLVALGARRIRLCEEVKDVKERDNICKIGGKYKIAKVNTELKQNRRSTVNIVSKIESIDPNRQPQPIDYIENLLEEKGLQHDSFLKDLLKRLKNDQKKRLYGQEKTSFNFLSEIEDALKITADINIELFFNAYAEFQGRLKQIHSFEQIVEVDFGN